jgi:hypothetical protein
MNLKEVGMTPDLVVGLRVQKKNGDQTIDGKVVVADWIPELEVDGKTVLVGQVDFEYGSKGITWINKPGFGCWKTV